jgi:hypothetical protein
MPRFYFPGDYDGFRYEDDRGEDFAAADEAGHYAERVAAELWRNNTKSVTVFVIAEDRFAVLHHVERGNPRSARPGTYVGLDARIRKQAHLCRIVARIKSGQ